jgi:hypothetical protein
MFALIFIINRSAWTINERSFTITERLKKLSTGMDAVDSANVINICSGTLDAGRRNYEKAMQMKSNKPALLMK